MSSGLVKVVVTSYNRPDWARIALDSVLAQTYENLHVVVVDDHSPDGTAKFLDAYAAAHPARVTVIKKLVNRGVADSIRLGIELGPQADYIAFLNDDDIWLPEKLARQIEVFEQDPEVGLVITEGDLIDASGQRTGRYSGDFAGLSGVDLVSLLRNNPACPPTLLMRADLSERVLRSMRSDTVVWDYTVVLVCGAYSRVVKLDDVLALYRISSSGQHLNKYRLWRHATEAREMLFAQNPDLVERLGGDRAVRRRLAFLAVDLAIWQELRTRRWRGYAWQSWAVIRQRQVRPVLALVFHTIRGLLRPTTIEGAPNEAHIGA